MLTKNSPDNPVMQLDHSAKEGLLLCYYDDLIKHIDHYMRGAKKFVQEAQPGDAIQWTITIASDEDILHYEAITGFAVLTYEEALERFKQTNDVFLYKGH